MVWIGWIAVGVLAICLLVGLDGALLAAAERLMQLGTLWDPSQQHALDQRDAEEDEMDEADDPDDL